MIKILLDFQFLVLTIGGVFMFVELNTGIAINAKSVLGFQNARH